jgi:hypothetical protein
LEEKDMKNRHFNESVPLEIGNGYVTDLMVTANGADATLELFDGKNDSGVSLMKILVKDGYTWAHSFKTYPYFNTGLYAKINADTTLCNVGWRMNT